MANRNPPTNGFKKGTKAYTLRKNVGRPPVTPVSPTLTGDKTFRHLFRTYIREKEDSWFNTDLETDTRLEKIIKKLARELISDSVTAQAITSTFNYLEPIPKSELEGNTNESIPAEQKELVEKISKLSLDGIRKIVSIIEEEKKNEAN